MGHENQHQKPVRDGVTLDAWTLVYFFYDHAILIISCVGFGLAAAVFHLWTTPPVFSAHAVLEISKNDNFGDMQGRAEDLDSAALLKTIEQSIAGQNVLRRVAEANRLIEDPAFLAGRSPESISETEVIRHLNNKISVSLIRGTRLIAVEVRDRDAKRAQLLTQSLVDEFFAQNLAARIDSSTANREFLLGEAKRVGERLNASEEKLQAYREKYDAVGLDDRQNVTMERLRNLHGRLTQARSERLAIETDYKLINQILAENNLRALIEMRSIANQPEIIDLRRRINVQASSIATLRQSYRHLHPTLIRAEEEMRELNTALEDNLRVAASAVIQTYRSAQATEESMEAELARQEKAVIELDRIAIPYRALDREVQSDAALYQQLLTQLKATDVVQGMSSSGQFGRNGVILAERPLTPISPVYPRPRLALAIGFFGGAFLGLGLALLRRALDDTLPSVDDAEEYLSLPALAVIPRVRRSKLRRGSLASPHVRIHEAEAFRSLRTSLSLLRDDAAQRTVLFTSAVPGEGKSHCSCNYAVVVAQSGCRTLLIDGDMRRPKVLQIFGKPATARRLSDCLHDPAKFAAAVEATPFKNLFVLGNVHGEPNSAELFATGNFKALMEQALTQFDRVIIDSAPVAIVSDTLHLAQYANTVCLVVRARSTPRRIVRRACTLLSEVAHKPPLGVVLNHIRRSRASGYYYYYYGKKEDGDRLIPIPATT